MLEFKTFAISPGCFQPVFILLFSTGAIKKKIFPTQDIPRRNINFIHIMKIISLPAGNLQEHLEKSFVFTFNFLCVFSKNSSYLPFQKSLIVK